MTLEIILRAVFGVSEGPRLDRLRGMLATVLQETASPRAQLVGLGDAALRRPRTVGEVRRPADVRSTSSSTPRSPSTDESPTWRIATTSSQC